MAKPDEMSQDQAIDQAQLTEEELAALNEEDETKLTAPEDHDNFADSDPGKLGDHLQLGEEGAEEDELENAKKELEEAKAAEAERAAKGDDEGKPDEQQQTPEEIEAARKAAEEAANAAAEEARKQAEAMPQKPDDLDPAMQDRLDAIASEKAKLDEQMDDGDLTTSEWRQAVTKLEKEERDLEWKIRDHEKAVEDYEQKSQQIVQQQQQTAQQTWANTVQTFLKDHDGYKEGSGLYNALDAEIKAMSGNDQYDNLSFEDFIDQAHKNVCEQLKVDPDALKTVDKSAAPTKKEETKTPLDKAKTPPNLSDLPAAADTEVGNPVWDKLDRLANLDPDAYEEAFASLSPSDQEKYLAAQ